MAVKGMLKPAGVTASPACRLKAAPMVRRYHSRERVAALRSVTATAQTAKLMLPQAAPQTSITPPVEEEQLLQTTYPLSISWAGAGIFFFWQLGAAKYLREVYDLTKVPMAGASGGALAAVLCACNVDPDKTFEAAYKLSVEREIWTRPLGLVGIWGKLIEEWLDELLPENAVELCRGRVSIIVTTLPKFEQVAYSDFKDRHDLINIAMTSAHVPFFLDGKLARSCRGSLALDGSFPDFFTGENSHHLVQDGRTVVFDYFNDPLIKRNGRMDFLELKAHEEIERIMNLGYDYAKKLHEDGTVSKFDAEFCRRVLFHEP